MLLLASTVCCSLNGSRRWLDAALCLLARCIAKSHVMLAIHIRSSQETHPMQTSPRLVGNQQMIAAFANKYGLSPQQRQDISGGYDLGQYMEIRTLEPGDRLLQFLRNPHADTLSDLPPKHQRRYEDTINPPLGNWFAYKGATMSGLSIMGGLSGRRLIEFEVLRHMEGLEGIASPIKEKQWTWAGGGGNGGHTQLFLPDLLLTSLRGLGPPV